MTHKILPVLQLVQLLGSSAVVQIYLHVFENTHVKHSYIHAHTHSSAKCEKCHLLLDLGGTQSPTDFFFSGPIGKTCPGDVREGDVVEFKPIPGTCPIHAGRPGPAAKHGPAAAGLASSKRLRPDCDSPTANRTTEPCQVGQYESTSSPNSLQ